MVLAQLIHSRMDKTLEQRRAAQDYVHKGICANLDLAAQDNHSKFERQHFAVVGEGTKSALASYRSNYDRINWQDGKE